ncbi:SWIM zinc finger domain-containing protein [Halobaculum rubrum]|uniref:SWIM zinc finger domain-containing protein n=1 Tax=Halobaculum rubrum TaxID=2872158 RepID=UPI001CA416EB|nr:SWIM zinc finger domain-containing protein [Halobaculum rubrum]QZY00900.1 SWIM zinc finger family protein [Halobaculum rubrum]
MTPPRTAGERSNRSHDGDRYDGDRGSHGTRGRSALPEDVPDTPDGPDGPGGPNDLDGAADPRDSGRTARARTEPMAVYALRDDDRYLVDTDGGTYVVDLGSDTCTCPDHAIRGSRCKHLRRVDMEVGIGRVPAPGERVAACAVCGDGVFVPARETGAFLCGDHRPAVGSFVRDRETDKRLVVTGVTTDRADEYATEEGTPIADYETNADYGNHEPVIEAVYAGNAPASPGPMDVSGRKRYGFPASRLRRLDPTDRPETPVIGI